MLRRSFKEGDCVVYGKLKHTAHPGRRARNVHASERGDNYTYIVDKFWVVVEVLDDDKLLLETRRGKTHVVAQSDPNLRPATFWDRIRYRDRFAQLQHAKTAT